MRILLIDDVRTFTVVDAIARNYNEGIRQLERNGPWDEVYLDHDLGDASFCEERSRYMTGYDVMCWLEANPGHLPKEIILVTDNPVGRTRMQQVIDKLYKGEDR